MQCNINFRKSDGCWRVSAGAAVTLSVVGGKMVLLCIMPEQDVGEGVRVFRRWQRRKQKGELAQIVRK